MNENPLSSTIALKNGVQIPQIGLGVYQSRKGEETRKAVRWALAEGYRHIDTARVYGNERDVGAAVRESGLQRSEVFVTTKLWNGDQGYDSTIAALDKSLERLGFEYVDLYLIHWPVRKKRLDSWYAMETVHRAGKCRAIGVSNYLVPHLVELMDICKEPPAINQIEMSPYNYLHRKDTLEFCEANHIRIEAYSPLTRGQKLTDPNLAEVAARYDKTPAQILIRWCLQHDFVVLPKSVHEERIRENGQVFDFAISSEDMAFLDGLNEGLATGWDPADEP